MCFPSTKLVRLSQIDRLDLLLAICRARWSNSARGVLDVDPIFRRALVSTWSGTRNATREICARSMRERDTVGWSAAGCEKRGHEPRFDDAARAVRDDDDVSLVFVRA